MNTQQPRAARHAKRRFLEYLGDQLPDSSWTQIVQHARAGSYTRVKPSKRHPRSQRTERRQRSNLPVFDVPLLDGDLVIWTPMVVNTAQGVVVTVLPPRPGGPREPDPAGAVRLAGKAGGSP